jgi:hypothetical protein
MKPTGITDRSQIARLSLFSIQYCRTGYKYLKPVADSSTYLTKKKTDNFCRLRN